MNKHLLVTISDESEASPEADFLAHFFSRPESLRLTFFYTAPRMERNGAGHGDETLPVTCGLETGAAMAHDSLEKVRRLLCARGFGRGLMEAKIVFRQYPRLLDALMEGEKGLYDAVVIGHQGLGMLEEAYGGNAARRMLEARANAPLWVCRDVPEGRSGVLLCVDGSLSSQAMADHVGFMLDQEPGHRVTLVTVRPEGGDEARGAFGASAEALEAAMAALMGNGVPEERIEVKVLMAREVGPSLLAEADAGGYAVVAMGRTGSGQGRATDLFMGSAVDYLYQHLRGAALWVCR